MFGALAIEALPFFVVEGWIEGVGNNAEIAINGRAG